MTTYEITLINSADGTVHGHKAGCRDIAREAAKFFSDEPWTFEVASKREAYLEYNADFIEESGEEEGHWAIDWKPCANEVPDDVTVEEEEQAKMTAEEFAQALTEKFADKRYALRVFSVQRGPKYTRVVQEQAGEDTGRPAGTTHGGSVHCFIENATGHVLKAASWKAPAKGVRFATMEEALAAADVNGSYLYKR